MILVAAALALAATLTGSRLAGWAGVAALAAAFVAYVAWRRAVRRTRFSAD